MADYWRRTAVNTYDLNHIKAEKWWRLRHPAHVPDGSAGKAASFPSGYGIGRPAEIFVFAGFDFDKNQHAASGGYDVNFVAAADTRAPGQYFIAVAAQFGSGGILTPGTRGGFAR